MNIHRVPRFWCSRTAEYQLDGLGYLLGPADVRYGRSLNPEAVATDEVLSHPCAVLVGEPGADKSTAIQEMRDQLDARTSREDLVWVRELGKYGDGRWLADDVFRARRIEAWKAGNGRLGVGRK